MELVMNEYGRAGQLSVAPVSNLSDLTLPERDPKQLAIDRIQPLLSQFNELQWSDRAQFDKALADFPQRTSELTFVNLFAWAPIQYPRWAEINGHLIVSYDPGNTGESPKFLPPIGPDPVMIMEQLHSEFGAVFARVDKAHMENLQLTVATEVTPDDHDYLYSVDQIQKLEGSKSSELRRRLGKFNKNVSHDVSTASISVETINDARTVVDSWLGERLASSGDKGKIEDATACNRILDRWEELPQLRGTLVYHKGIPVSLAVGELVQHSNQERSTLIVHFEKSVISKELEGLPVFSFQKLCAELPEGCVVNRMQSAGVDGLKKWKESWGPSGLQEKIVVGKL